MRMGCVPQQVSVCALCLCCSVRSSCAPLCVFRSLFGAERRLQHARSFVVPCHAMAPRVASNLTANAADAAKKRRLSAPEPPLPPQLPTLEDVLNGVAPALGGYIISVERYVRHHGPVLLSKPTSEGGLGIPDAELHTHDPLPITCAHTAEVRSYKPAWKMEECAISLTATQLYEAAANAYGIKPEAETAWKGQAVPGAKCQWDLVLSCLGNWSSGALIASAEQDYCWRPFARSSSEPNRVVSARLVRAGLLLQSGCFSPLRPSPIGLFQPVGSHGYS